MGFREGLFSTEVVVREDIGLRAMDGRDYSKVHIS